MPWLINATQLEKFRKNQKSLVILDATLHTPGSDQNAYQEFLSQHIMGAQYFNIHEFNDKSSTATHSNMVKLDPEFISQKLSELGIRNDYKIIFYDNSNLHTACRALWMFKLFGHNPQLLYILDGGLKAWQKFGGKTETGAAQISPKQYNATLQLQYVCTLAQIKENLHSPQAQIIDVRNAVRYAGGPESRPGLRAGHIPGSICFPYTSLFDNQGYWRPLEKIRQVLQGVCVDLSLPQITSCGSGTTAPIMNFALDLLGQENNAVYNGSWTEWGNLKLFEGEQSLNERPVETCLQEI